MTGWLIPSIIATLMCTIILASTYYFLYRSDRKPYLGIWTWGWFVYGLRFVFMLLHISATSPNLKTLFLVANQVVSLASGILLLWGVHVFLNRRFHKYWLFLGILFSLYIALLGMFSVPFFHLTLPTFLFLGLVYVWTGVIFLRWNQDGEASFRILGISFILWGVHKADYPILRPVAWLAPWGYLLGAALALVVAIGMLMVYFKRTQKRMEQSEEKYRLVVENAGDAVFVAQEGMLQFVNKKAEELSGFTAEELRSRPFVNFIHPDDRGLVLERHAQRQRGEEIPSSYAFRIIHKSGEEKWVELNAVPIDWQGKASSLNFLRDITERNRAAEALQESEERLRLSLAGSGISFWEWFPETGRLRLDDSWVKLLALEPDKQAVDFQWWWNRVHPDSMPVFEEALKGYLEGDRSRFELEYRIQTDSGAWKWVWAAGECVQWNAEGKPMRFLGTHRDITARKQVEESLSLSVKEWQSTFDATHDAIWIIDKEHRILRSNKTASEIFQRPIEEIIGKHCWEIVHGTDGVIPECPCPRAEISRRRENMELRLNGKWFEVTVDPIPDARGEYSGAVHIVTDITERKHAELEKEKLQAQLEQSRKMESVGRLAGGVAHDFNNMLGVILGHTELAMCEPALSPSLLQALEEIEKAARRSADLTQQLLAFARRQTAAPRVLDLNETVSGMLNMLRRLIGEDIDLAWSPGKGLWPIKMDPVQIDQILANLCVNGRDAIGGVGRISIETRNEVIDEVYCMDHGECVPGDYVLITVDDNGCGMDKETLETLFEPFFTTKEVGEGTGLGLATVYGIVKQNNGFINVYSEPGVGTTFKVYLPRTRQLLKTKGKAAVKTTAEGTETVLLVEDEESILRLGKAVLERSGYSVLAARTPKEALTLVEGCEGPIHLLVTDVVMPEMNGKELKSRIEKLRPDIKAVFMSGYTANAIVHRGILEEKVDFLPKPFSVDSLVGKVREVLDRRD